MGSISAMKIATTTLTDGSGRKTKTAPALISMRRAIVYGQFLSACLAVGCTLMAQVSPPAVNASQPWQASAAIQINEPTASQPQQRGSAVANRMLPDSAPAMRLDAGDL